MENDESIDLSSVAVRSDAGFWAPPSDPFVCPSTGESVVVLRLLGPAPEAPPTPGPAAYVLDCRWAAHEACVKGVDVAAEMLARDNVRQVSAV